MKVENFSASITFLHSSRDIRKKTKTSWHDGHDKAIKVDSGKIFFVTIMKMDSVD
jgi:hypothetical protein